MKDKDLERMTVDKICHGIESMKIRGAALIARAAALAMAKHVEEFDGDDLKEFKKWLKLGEEKLLSTRPTAVSLANALKYVLRAKGGDVESLKSSLKQRSYDFIESSHQAGLKIAKYGGKRIVDGDTILTHCNSSLALSAIEHAWGQGKKIEVIATESRPKRQGYITVRYLAERSIPVTLIVDSAVRYIMQKVDKVYLGADTVTSNGAVINKIGTSQIALCAHEARVPVSVCGETYKFSQDTLFGDLVKIEEREPSEIVDPSDFPGVKIKNPVFDATPAEYIDVIITELGVISPSSAYRVIDDVLAE
ncbi:MAG: ribose 1,5-bisphosphate isomerase [Thermoplasmata archaeon]